MIIDGRQQTDRLAPEYDLIIVGAGPAGITLAMELEATGLRIALLESGGEDYDDAAQALNAGVIEGNDDEYDLEFSRLRHLGGTSNHWGGICRPLDQVDFERSWNGLSGWPMSRASLEPFYERAHPYCDLGAYRYAYEDLVSDGPDLELLASTPEVETVILRNSLPTRFGEKYREALSESSSIDVWLWTNAIRVATTPEIPQWVETRSFNGPDRRFTAKAVVLAAGTIEATRLLMWSNVQNETRAGNGGGHLGRCYMDHPSGGAAFLNFIEPQGDKIYWMDAEKTADEGTRLNFLLRLSDAHQLETGLPNAQFYVFKMSLDPEVRDRDLRADRSYRSLKTLVKWAIGRDPGGPVDVPDQYCSFIDGADDYLFSRVGGILSNPGQSTALLKYECEQRPDLNNGLRLSETDSDVFGMPRPILTWSPSDDDMEALRQTTMEIGRLAGATGLGRLQMEEFGDDPYWGATTAWHQMGTMRMAESPTGGAVDVNGRVHGAGALYASGAAVFPQVGAANPTLTIVALAIRLADHLKEEFAA